MSDEITWRGSEALRPLLVPLESLTPDPENARRHPERNIEAIRSSLRKFGQRKPIVAAMAAEGFVVAGNGTLEAARREGWTHLAVADASDLSSDQIAAYALADNQTGDLAEWDPLALAKALGALPEPLKAATGFEPAELQAIADLTFAPEKGTKAPESGTEAEFATIKVTRDQYTIIQGAVAKVQQNEGADVTPGRALELICAEYLSS